MAQRAVFLLSSSRVHGYGYLEHAKKELTKFLDEKNVKTVLFVPYAQKDYDKYAVMVQKVFRNWGYNMESIHQKTIPAKDAIQSAEAIFIGGGNTFLLLKTLYDLNLVEIIRYAVLNKGLPYIGSSAGTNVATRSIQTTNDMPIVYPPTFDALNLVPFNINPHYLASDLNTEHKGETRDERINEFLELHQKPVVGLREGTAIVVNGDKAVLVGDKAAKLFRPNSESLELQPNRDLSFLLNGDY